MKYHFLSLPHQLLDKSENKEALLSKSDKLSQLGGTYFENGIALLKAQLDDSNSYYIIHDVQKYKGKLLVDSGVTVIANKLDIITFVSEELKTGELRPIRIMARINPKFVISVNDELSFYLYQKNHET